ncbi:MAG TPA: cobaltochelatase subunit CobN [Gordonia sp. (in: high G+C Gram-positive bacteria)]|uniref:cobaltochelatase subunit CobN n=1 Tax=unclassified Gordonia (in: high G+C Gram-positive bacteria) TaxID=2657482 RepID=UPI000FACE32A|nr:MULTISPECIES: cobaltochelatase subunit CobN [unclassified Gordonia (in: high G+C Gram-positive bacteria)]RUP38659.1 MAG: cobaltochelatase subunit CobN [Gordonia sp. (in: high G+C Gram-positive bacteria)]HNP56339.1 cobaltochelatase subunit CobN [Gordonia sp. (in: high G+C Gram-positive bacteria)]HRC50023.1 cobaltochelatase subunit CobN [Gordonia sp. (in: high G+C Gram-positive bacteria)]
MILLLSTSDTDLITAAATGAPFRVANPSRIILDEIPDLARDADLIVVRILGGRRAWEDGIDAVTATGKPVVLLSGEQQPDPDLMAASTVPAGVAAQAHNYFAAGGVGNLVNAHNFLSDTVLLTGLGFTEPVVTPMWGVLERQSADLPGDAPTIAVLYYRAQHLAGNTRYVDALCAAIEAAGARPLPVFCSSLRTAPDELIELLGTADALIATVLAAGGTTPAEASAGGQDEAWDVERLAALDIPILQGLAVTGSREQWEANDDGLSPLDVASQVAVPEFDGRIITVPFSFKEFDDDGLPWYQPDEERCARVAGIAVRHARLRHLANTDKRIALVLSAYPTKHARIGNAVGLDTPKSLLRLLTALRAHGYDIGDPAQIPGLLDDDSDALMHALIEAGGQDPAWLTDEVLAANPIRVAADDYQRWFATLPADLREGVEEKWGPAPGDLFVDRSANPDGDIVVAAMTFGNVVLMVQPPRGFGENPVAIYHDPDLPPSHHYLAAYHWLAANPVADGWGFGADAVVHLGKHGNLEWLPGKTLGMSASCGTDAALGDLPLVYPFLVNDPGEGTQAKRRAHAVLVDHLIPPMARAESYGDIARLEQLLDEHANIAALDPAKLPAIRQQIWTLLTAAKMDHDLGLAERPDEEVFDDMLLHVDGWLCEIKDVQIRDGLHILGEAPVDDGEIDLVLAMLRARQLWGGSVALPGLREALGLDEDGGPDGDRTHTVDVFEAQARDLVSRCHKGGWTDDAVADAAAGLPTAVADVLGFAAREVVPRLRATSGEVPRVLHALGGGFIPAGPSGSPLRGLINVLPTGRNFYSVDPKAVPSRLAWETGRAMADSLLERYLADHGEYPRSVGLSVWGTSAMRTSGDDIAEVLALLGVEPVWDEASRRVVDLELIDPAELGRPRIDVTVRISGFFRDAFPHVVTMLDDAVALAAAADEPDEQNFIAAHVRESLAEHGDDRRARTRVFGSKPGTYGAGLLQLIDSQQWRSDEDLAAVYTAWGGYAYGRGLDGREAVDDMRSAYRRINVAAKNTDTREHDIADSDDYFQYHGGMVATVRALTGSDPEAYIGDSTRPDAVRTRTLSEEATRVFRARVVNPRWISAMQRHGYKGAFEMAATVDYLFGYDATTNVVADWMYEQLTQSYVLDEANREFLDKSNPWALHGITERLLEAAQRDLWESPPPEMLDELRRIYLQTEGDIEGRAGE